MGQVLNVIYMRVADPNACGGKAKFSRIAVLVSCSAETKTAKP